MRGLEAVYLTNVILYIESMETIIKLIQVNNKCQEATKMIRYFDKRKSCESDKKVDYNYYIVKNIFDIFPNIETIRCREIDIINNLELFDKVNQIELFGNYMFRGKISLLQETKNKIIKLDVNCYSLKNIRLNEFPSVKKVKIGYLEKGNLKEFLGNEDVKLNRLTIETEDNEEFEILKEYKNIENKIIKINNQITKERYQELNKFANVYSQYPIDDIDIKDSFCLFYGLNLSNLYDIDRLYDLTLFTRCLAEGDCDLRNCELLEEVGDVHPIGGKKRVQIEGLKHLKRIVNVKVDCIPTNVTYLSFTPSFNYNELLEKNIDCFINIRELQIKLKWNELFLNTKLLMNFKNCTKLELEIDDEQTFEIPINVIELIIYRSVNEDQIKEIGKITKLKKLEIHFSPNSNKEGIEEMYDKLKELECLTTDYIDGIKLPSSLTFLELEVNDNTDLSQYTNLKELNMRGSYHGDNREVKIPNKLNKLYIYGNIKVINSNEVEVGTIIFNNTPSQFCEWNSKNIFIVYRFTPFINSSKS